MFGLFKRSKPAKPGRSTIVPRIKHRDFKRAYSELDIPPEQQPVTESLVADLLVTYAFDLSDTFQMVTPASLADIGVPLRDLRETAIGNIAERVSEIKVNQKGSILQIVTGGSFEACTLLNGRFWDSLAEQVPGSLVVSVPHRDVVLACSVDDPEALDQIRAIADEIMQGEDNHSLTRCLLSRRNSSWHVYEK